MNRRKSSTKREALLRKAYGPRRQHSKIRQKPSKSSHKSAFSAFSDLSCFKPFQFARRPVESLDFPRYLNCYESGDSFVCEVLCYQELAYEVISRDLHEHIRQKYGLVRTGYTGEAFLFESEDMELLVKAANDLSVLMCEYRPKSTEVCENPGNAEDLVDVPFDNEIEFLGEPNCVFCGCDITEGDIVRRTVCLHIFHSECIKPWLAAKRVCPVDKMPI